MRLYLPLSTDIRTSLRSPPSNTFTTTLVRPASWPRLITGVAVGEISGGARTMRICFSAPWLAGWLEARAVFVAVERNDVIAVRIAVLHGGFAHAAFVARRARSLHAGRQSERLLHHFVLRQRIPHALQASQPARARKSRCASSWPRR